MLCTRAERSARGRRCLAALVVAALAVVLTACAAPSVPSPAVVRPTRAAVIRPTPSVAIAQQPTATAPPPTATAPPAPPPRPTGTATIAATPTADPAAIVARAHVPVLCYHHIRNWLPSDTPADKPYIVPLKRFRAELDDLVHHGWHTITLDQLDAYLTAGTPLPPKPIVLTFDDGDANQWTLALPELQQRHLTAAFFIMTVTLDQPHYLTTAQVRMLDRMGMTIGAHTWDHHPVTRYHGDEWRRQITVPTQQLATITGHPIRYFAYPDGLWNAAAIPQVQAAGFAAAFQLADPLDARAPLYTLRRVIANSYWSLAQFETAISTWF